MIKVAIADDEKRVLKLIQKIVNWAELGLEVVGTANDGIEILEIIKEKKPHIVITDIRMPGYQGIEMIERAKRIDNSLEFIIISGYGQFEYAKKAIEFGVKDYLLKPINKEELTKTLINVKKHIEENINFIPGKEDIKLIRKSFLNNFLFNNGEFNDISINEINKKYRYNFIDGYFNVVFFKIDYHTNLGSKIKDIANNITKIIEEELKGNNEQEIIINRNNIFLLLNYKKEESEKIDKKIKNIHEKINISIYSLKETQVTIAYGKEVQRLEDVIISFQTANLMIEDRILEGRNKIYKYNNFLPIKKEIDDIFYGFIRRFIKHIEILDCNKVQHSFMNFKKEIRKVNIRGFELKDKFRELFKIYFLTLKNNKFIDGNLTLENEEIKKIIEESSSTDNLFDNSLKYILNHLNLITNKRSENNILQIRKAKKYIEENYMKNIKLEDIGEYIGFNPSYFSSRFKKETGNSFIEYLSMVRIDKAKELLKESDLKIQDISYMIGYNDPKYFTKIFVKYSGLKPKEYRKLFM